MFSEETYPKLSPVDEVFDTKLSLRLSGKDSLELRELSQAGVSSNQSIVYSPRAKALFVGDLIHFKAHAWLEGGIVEGAARPELSSWKDSLKRLSDLYPASSTVYAGRGEAAKLKPAVAEQIAYLKRAEELVKNYVRKLGDKKAELSSEKADAHYTALRKIFEAEFPGYALSYMIQYGVYGLAQQIAAE